MMKRKVGKSDWENEKWSRMLDGSGSAVSTLVVECISRLFSLAARMSGNEENCSIQDTTVILGRLQVQSEDLELAFSSS